mmetsp:Transcript_99015/g.283279  ORF Transcript_99015/g.283279 Transcript_99015/m.283279 type:complete len:220 (+) Transcript_99015:119-778(+)
MPSVRAQTVGDGAHATHRRWSPPRNSGRPPCSSSELTPFGKVLEQQSAEVVLGEGRAPFVRLHDAVGHIAQRLLDQPDRERGVVLADLVDVANTHQLRQPRLDTAAEYAVKALGGGLSGDACELGARVIRQGELVREAAAQARIGVEQFVHGLLVTGQYNHYISSVVLGLGQQGRDRVVGERVAVAATAPSAGDAGERVGLVQEEGAALCGRERVADAR